MVHSNLISIRVTLKTVSLVLSVSTVTALLEMGGIMGGLYRYLTENLNV